MHVPTRDRLTENKVISGCITKSGQLGEKQMAVVVISTAQPNEKKTDTCKMGEKHTRRGTSVQVPIRQQWQMATRYLNTVTIIIFFSNPETKHMLAQDSTSAPNLIVSLQSWFVPFDTNQALWVTLFISML